MDSFRHHGRWAVRRLLIDSYSRLVLIRASLGFNILEFIPGEIIMTFEMIGTPGNTYTTRGLSYVANSRGIISLAFPSNHDFEDLINAGCFPVFATKGVLLGRLIGANMNSGSADQPFVMTNQSNLVPFRPVTISCKNASVSLTTAAGGIYTAAAQGGTAVVASGQVYTGLTAASLILDLTIATTPAKTVLNPGTAFFLNLTTAQGAAATADFFIWGDLYC